MFFKTGIFRKNIEPRCFYCLKSILVDEQSMICKKRGIMPYNGNCKSFKYDPLKRIPPKPAILRTNFDASDFYLEENNET